MAQTKKSAAKSNFLASPTAKVVAGVVAVALVAAASITGYTLLNRSSAGAAGAATCGSGYAAFASKSGTYGTLQGYFNKKAKSYCYILVATGKASGVSKAMSVSAGKGGSDSGNYLYYAGPVYGKSSGASGSMTFEKKNYNFTIVPGPEG